MMKRLSIVILVTTVCILQAGCSKSQNSEITPEQIHQSCLAVFERKGGPPEMAKQMCDSMKEACEKDLTGDDCKKAQRMIEKS